MFITPIEKILDFYVKRDDLFSVAGVFGGKARTCFELSKNSVGLITAGSRHSPQVKIVSSIAKYLNIPCRVHIPQGEETAETIWASNNGAKIFKHFPGYNTVIIKRALDDWEKNYKYTYIPFGMECEQAVNQTSLQVIDLPNDTNRIIVPVGSGMSLCGIINGLKRIKSDIPVLGVVVGADPTNRIKKYGCEYKNLQLVESSLPYEKSPKITNIGGIELDKIYESKRIEFLRPKDLLWIVGIR